MTLGTSLVLDLQSRSDNLPILILRIAKLVRASVQDCKAPDLLVLVALLYARALHESQGLSRQQLEDRLVKTFRATLRALHPEEM